MGALGTSQTRPPRTTRDSLIPPLKACYFLCTWTASPWFFRIPDVGLNSLICQSRNRTLGQPPTGKMNTRLLVMAGFVAVMFLAKTNLSSAQERSHSVVVKAFRQASAPPLNQMVSLALQSKPLTSLLANEDDEGRPRHGLRQSGSRFASSGVGRSGNTEYSPSLRSPSLSTTSGLRSRPGNRLS